MIVMDADALGEGMRILSLLRQWVKVTWVPLPYGDPCDFDDKQLRRILRGSKIPTVEKKIVGGKEMEVSGQVSSAREGNKSNGSDVTPRRVGTRRRQARRVDAHRRGTRSRGGHSR